MPYEWLETQYQNFNYDFPSGGDHISDMFYRFHDNVTIMRSQVWWDVRFRVEEDHTFQPRAPYPLNFKVLQVDNSTGNPEPGVQEDPLITGMMAATPTESFGAIIGTGDTQERLWVGNSGGQPMESKAERKGGTFGSTDSNLRIYVTWYNDATSPTGAIEAWPALFLIRYRWLVKFDPFG